MRVGAIRGIASASTPPARHRAGVASVLIYARRDAQRDAAPLLPVVVHEVDERAEMVRRRGRDRGPRPGFRRAPGGGVHELAVRLGERRVVDVRAQLPICLFLVVDVRAQLSIIFLFRLARGDGR